MDLNKLTISQAAKLLEEKKISSFQLTKACLEEIKKGNKEINPFITVCEKEALEQAKESDKRRSSNLQFTNHSPLDGIPIAIKDNICTKGTRTTAGSKILENFIPPYDATVVGNLKKAGAVILGKTNCDEFAMGSSGETSYFKPTKNPLDLTKVPGGSSSGSGAAVAADMCLGALGSDTGGSIRQPAYFCGLVGFKPTYGRVSRYGLIAYASSLDQIGVITKTVEDAKLLYSAISSYDKQDSTSIEKVKSQKSKIKSHKLKIGRIGKDLKLPSLEFALAAYYVIALAEASSNLARYEGIKYGYSPISDKRLVISDLLDLYFKARSEGFGPEVKRRIILGTYVLSAGYIGKYYLKAVRVRAQIKKEFVKAFERFDLLEMPVSPTGPWKLGEKISDPLSMYLMDIYTVPVNLAGLPAIALPDNRQIIGPPGEDERVLDYAIGSKV